MSAHHGTTGSGKPTVGETPWWADYAQRSPADAKAMDLLVWHLTDEQCKEFTDHKRFEVLSPLGRLWVVKWPASYEYVHIYHNTSTQGLYGPCWTVDYTDRTGGYFPLADVMYAQKVAIEVGRTDQMFRHYFE